VARILVFGLNRDTISDGDAAVLSFVIGEKTTENTRLVEGKIDASSAAAKSVPVTLIGGVVHVAL
jgi:hypothetical protein